MTNDLVFKQAPAIAGGREFRTGGGELEKGSQSSSMNNFQGRYAIRHAWTGKIACENPVRGRWGGPPAGVSGSSDPKPATELAFAPRGKVKLASLVQRDIPEIGVKAASGQTPTGGTDTAQNKTQPVTPEQPATTPSKTSSDKKSKGCSAIGADNSLLFALFLICLSLALRRRRATDS